MFYKYYNIHTVKVCLFTKLSPCQFYTFQKTRKQNNEQQIIPKTLIRSAIGTYFLKVLGNPEKKSWKGVDGVISLLLKVWKLPEYSRRFVERILEQCSLCATKNITYRGLTKANLREKGRCPSIQQGSVEEGIIADWMEAGLGFRFTTAMVNQNLMESGKTPVSLSAIYEHFDRMNPTLTKISKCCQSNNNNKAWVNARFRQCKQFSIMFGKIKKSDLKSEYNTLPIPPHYDPELLPQVSPDQVVWFDETHIQQEGGRVTRIGVLIRFPRNENGAFCPQSDTMTSMYAHK